MEGSCFNPVSFSYPAIIEFSLLNSLLLYFSADSFSYSVRKYRITNIIEDYNLEKQF